MPAIHEPPTRDPPQQLRQKRSDVSTGHRSAHSNGSQTSLSSSSPPPSPTPASPPSPRATEISNAFLRVRDCSTALRSALLKGSEVATEKCVEEFERVVQSLFKELQHLPDNVPPTPVLISAIQGCSFEVLCFTSSVARPHADYEGREERQSERAIMLNEVMASTCMLLELAAQVIEDAEVERNRLEESAEVDTSKAERDFGSRPGSSMDDRPLSWLSLAVNGSGSGPPEQKRRSSSAGHFARVSSTNLDRSLVPPNGRTPTPNRPVFSRKELLIPEKRPSKGKYDIRHLKESVHKHRLDVDALPLRDSLAIIGDSAPFPTDLHNPDPNDLDAPYVKYNPDSSIEKANLRGLVGVITSGSAIEHEEFVLMVLTTFRLFSSGQNLADALFSRYTEKRPEWLDRKGRARFEWGMAQKRMKARVAMVLHLWLELHWKPEDSGAIATLQLLVETMERDRAFHAPSLRASFDRIVKEEDYYGLRFRKGERYKSTSDSAALAKRNPSSVKISQFATPEGVVKFARMITMVESSYYHTLSSENFVHYKSVQTQELRKKLGDFEQRYKAWIVWTIVTPEDPVERALVIKFWFDVAKTCVQYRNFNTAYQIKCVLGDPEFEKMAITRQVLEQFDKGAIYEFWKVCCLYENDAWWGEINSSSLPAIPVSQILIRWRIYIEECGLRGVYKHTRDFSLPEFKSKGRIDVNSFLNLADLIWDIERTYKPHTFDLDLDQVTWVKDWFLAQVFTPDLTDFGLETRHFKTGVAKDNPVPVVPDTILAKLVAMFEAKLRRKKEVKLIPLVPRKPSAEIIKKTSANRLQKRKRPTALILSNQPQPQPPPSRPGTPVSQNCDAQNQHQPNRLRKRSRSSTRPSPESIQQSLPAQTPVTPPPLRDKERGRASEAALYRPTARINFGPPPSPSHGRRFDGKGVPGRRTPEKFMTHPLQFRPPSPPLERAKFSAQDWEII